MHLDKRQFHSSWGGLLKSFAIGLVVFYLGWGFAVWLPGHGLWKYVDNVAAGVAAAVLVLLYERSRQRTINELAQSEERFRGLVESANDWVWEVDSEARYTYAGPQSRAVLGYEPEEMIGKTPFDFMTEQEARRVRERFMPIAQRQKPFHGLESVSLHRNGLPVVLETNGSPVFDEHGGLIGYRGMDRDVTERRRAEIALRENEFKYRSLADNLPGVVFQFFARDTGERGYYFVHENSRSLLGIEAEPWNTWMERALACLKPEDLRRCLESIELAIGSGGIWDFESAFTKPSGESIYVRGVSKSQRRGTEQIFHGILLDITPQKQAEKLLRELGGRLIEVQEKERESIARKLHESICQDLAALAMKLFQTQQGVVANPKISDEIGFIQKMIEQSVNDLSRLCHDLHPTNLKHVGISAALKSLCKDVSSAYQFPIEFLDGAFATSISDEVQLSLYRIAQEAIANVVRHSKCSRATVRLNGEREVFLTVEDDGVGFDVNASRSGLGLLSIRERLRVLSGEMSIESQAGKGTTMKVHLPAGQS